MSKEFKLPELGENIESADVLTVLVSEGDEISLEQSVIEIETDKATIEVPSTIAGTVKKISVKAGDTVKVGQTILVIEDEGISKKEEKVKKEDQTSKKEESKIVESPVKERKKADESKSSNPKTIDYKLPELGENIDFADILSVLVKEGDSVVVDQSLLEIETDKATIEVPSTVNGIIEKIFVKKGDKPKVGDVIFKINTSDIIKKEIVQDKKEISAIPKAEEKKIDPTKGEIENSNVGEFDDHQPPITKGAAPAAPSVRRLARELGIDIKKVKGSGTAGRISMDDVKAYVKALNLNRSSVVSTGIPQEKLPDFSKHGQTENVSMTKIRKVTAKHLSYAWSTIPHVTQFDKADITELEQQRKKLNPKVEKAGGKLTVTSILIKVITAALQKFPNFNSSIDMEKQEIIFKKYFNIGIAVDTENGLIVPVVKNTDSKNLAELSVEMGELAKKARDRKISLDDLQGGCITITNLGGIGGTSFTPIVNSPEVAILGVSRGNYEPVYIDGEFKPRLKLPLSLSYDHRIIDGADAAKFLRWVCEELEKPSELLKELI